MVTVTLTDPTKPGSAAFGGIRRADSDDLVRSSAKLLKLSEHVQKHTGALQTAYQGVPVPSLGDRAAALIADIGRAKQTVASMATFLKQRAIWAEIANENPEAAKYLDRLERSDPAKLMDLYLASTLWNGMPNGPADAALKDAGLGEALQYRGLYYEHAPGLEEDILRQAKLQPKAWGLERDHKIHDWSDFEEANLQASIDEFWRSVAVSSGTEAADAAVAEVMKSLGASGYKGGALGALFVLNGVIVGYEGDRADLWVSEDQAKRRAWYRALGGAGLLVAGLVAGASCATVILCVAVGAGIVGWGVVLEESVDHTFPDDEVPDFDDYHEEMEWRRRQALEDLPGYRTEYDRAANEYFYMAEADAATRAWAMKWHEENGFWPHPKLAEYYGTQERGHPYGSPENCYGCDEYAEKRAEEVLLPSDEESAESRMQIDQENWHEQKAKIEGQG